jgi:hypothetical protein
LAVPAIKHAAVDTVEAIVYKQVTCSRNGVVKGLVGWNGYYKVTLGVNSIVVMRAGFRDVGDALKGGECNQRVEVEEAEHVRVDCFDLAGCHNETVLCTHAMHRLILGLVKLDNRKPTHKPSFCDYV